jgi:hypothetical protein
MMHPSRQAYVEEDEPEVSFEFPKPTDLRDVHTSTSEPRRSLAGDPAVGISMGRRLMGHDLIGYRDGGGHGQHTYENSLNSSLWTC